MTVIRLSVSRIFSGMNQRKDTDSFISGEIRSLQGPHASRSDGVGCRLPPERELHDVARLKQFRGIATRLRIIHVN
ncbi:hypothetical protein AA0242T_2859 [Acetobacter aceti NRIC 0242]|uniref:Uncharacterized protein n=1 Tax=Acetobacter aceti NBRC 14818 TaxID=887700 RepID=A0AB33IKE2_ACEAC|nr:hypothetical protein EMQ_2737 [Acetobacter aceti NBRC 14818]GAN57860.1 hypothetical protein Abac_021_025 [Acetobacter aceti NBRC 14818]GBO82157.1 hypothetical protein AA0242T_2859 [Acetobacter aceti NRIC 0242]